MIARGKDAEVKRAAGDRGGLIIEEQGVRGTGTKHGREAVLAGDVAGIRHDAELREADPATAPGAEHQANTLGARIIHS